MRRYATIAAAVLSLSAAPAFAVSTASASLGPLSIALYDLDRSAMFHTVSNTARDSQVHRSS